MSSPGASAERRKGYARWEGERTAQASRWWVIARGNLSLAWSNRWVKVLLLASLIPGIVVAGITYFFLPLSARALAGILDASRLFAFLTAAVIGSRLVSEDRRQGAFLAYFSRPVTRVDYLVGKLAALLIPLLFVTAAPALLAILADASVAGETFFDRVVRETGEAPVGSDYLRAVGYGDAVRAILAWSLLASLPTAGIVLGVSALADRARTAGVLWFGGVALLEAAAGILGEATGEAWPALLSWFEGLQALAAWQLDLDGLTPDPSPLQHLTVLTAVALAGVLLVHERLRRAEGVHR